MAHELDFSRGKAAIAYRGDVPWHGFGETITENMTLEQMRTAASLDWEVLETDSFYPFEGELLKVPNRKALVRSDTGEFLSHMSENKYEVRQPEMIVEFFRDLCDHGGYEIETLGALFGGRKVWCLAKRKGLEDGLGDDIIKPYILLADSYDGTLATVARFTTVRVVCNNTLGFSEKDKATQVKIGHNQSFNPDKIKAELGKIDEGFGRYMESMKAFAQVKMSDDFKKRFFLKLFAKPEVFGESKGEGMAWKRAKLDYEAISTASKNTVAELIRLSHDGNSPGANFFNDSLYNALQTVTYYIDHEARTKNDLRWQSACMGNGNKTKQEALELALSLVD